MRNSLRKVETMSNTSEIPIIKFLHNEVRRPHVMTILHATTVTVFCHGLRLVWKCFNSQMSQTFQGKKTCTTITVLSHPYSFIYAYQAPLTTTPRLPVCWCRGQLACIPALYALLAGETSQAIGLALSHCLSGNKQYWWLADHLESDAIH